MRIGAMLGFEHLGVVMKSGLSTRVLALAATAGLGLAACSSAPKIDVSTPIAPTPPPLAPPIIAPKLAATPGLSPRERVQKILQLLNAGDPAHARPEAEQLLLDQPGNALAQSLFDQIDKDPHFLLGEKNFPYRVQPGETLSILADRFLGDRFLFYALARYNNLEKPGATEVGQTILVPGAAAPRVVAAPKKKRPADTESEAEAIDARLGVRKGGAPTPSPAPAPVKAARDPKRADALRGQALALLNGGSADRAVELLRSAARLDPESAAIRRDLSRAERIQTAVHK